jgi:hypothetical protein
MSHPLPTKIKSEYLRPKFHRPLPKLNAPLACIHGAVDVEGCHLDLGMPFVERALQLAEILRALARSARSRVSCATKMRPSVEIA